MNKEKPEVIFVHAVDTEGPLFESLKAKFERIYDLFGIQDIKPTRENFLKLQKGEIDLGGVEKKIKEVLNNHLVSYNDTWDKIDHMLSKLFSRGFRNKYLDSQGDGWKCTWHCLDHVGFEYNPRRRDIGYHNIYDHYNRWVNEYPELGDDIEWHFHPMSTYSDAHRCATHYFRNDLVYQILCRKIIERNWFPTCFRAGFQAERPDSHWFLEQWFPFDITNMAVSNPEEFDKTADFRLGRSGNWRRSPSDWSIYNPSHDDYQIPGNCRRRIGRALNIMNRVASIDIDEIRKAFYKASRNGSRVLVGVTSHDFRNMLVEIDHVRSLIYQVSPDYPEVNLKFCTVKEGFRRAIWGEKINESVLKLEVELINKSDDIPYIIAKSVSGEVFGPQPFLSIKTKSRRFLYDNFDSIAEGCWGYAFHGDTLPINDVDEIGIAANDQYGNTSICKVKLSK